MLAVEREHRIGVAEAALGDRHRLAVFQPHEDDLREARADRVAVGQPRAVRGERDVVDLAVAAAGQLAELTIGEQEQPPVVGGEGDALAVGRGHELQHAAELAEPLRSRGASGARGSSGAMQTASSPSASSTHTARSSPSGAASRARTPGVACSVRAGPSRWVSRCTVPRTPTTLDRPVVSGRTRPSHSPVVMR